MPIAVPTCPRCSGEMYDNRASKKNPKSPDFRCKDKECTDDKGYVTGMWEKDVLKNARATPAPALNVKGAYSGGPHIPGLDPEPGEEDALPFERFDRMATLYTKSYKHAFALAKEQFGNDVSDTAVSAMAATIYIQACQAGLHR